MDREVQAAAGAADLSPCRREVSGRRGDRDADRLLRRRGLGARGVDLVRRSVRHRNSQRLADFEGVKLFVLPSALTPTLSRRERGQRLGPPGEEE